MTRILLKRGNLDPETDTHRWKMVGNRQEEDGLPLAKERGWKRPVPSWPSGGTSPGGHLDLRLLVTRAVRQYVSLA